MRVHIKMDTGMGRIGVDSLEIFRFVEKAAGMKNITIEGFLSHLSVASGYDDDDVRFTRDQLASFAFVRKGLEDKGYGIPVYHIANSGGLLNYPESHHNSARPGIILYGCKPSEDFKMQKDLKRVLCLGSNITFIKRVPTGTSISYGRETKMERESLIATVPVGYADGIPRRLKKGFEFIVKGMKAPLAGVVTMDMIMLDVTDVRGVSEGDEVVLIGESGENSVSVEDMAESAGTISYEILTSLGSRVARKYIGREEGREK